MQPGKPRTEKATHMLTSKTALLADGTQKCSPDLVSVPPVCLKIEGVRSDRLPYHNQHTFKDLMVFNT
jgi:hypothetical protein